MDFEECARGFGGVDECAEVFGGEERGVEPFVLFDFVDALGVVSFRDDCVWFGSRDGFGEGCGGGPVEDLDGGAGFEVVDGLLVDGSDFVGCDVVLPGVECFRESVVVFLVEDVGVFAGCFAGFACLLDGVVVVVSELPGVAVLVEVVGWEAEEFVGGDVDAALLEFGSVGGVGVGYFECVLTALHGGACW